jgi:hypothetical protein
MFFRLARVLLSVCVLAYAALTGALYWLMRQPVERFGAIMRHVPDVAVMVLPFRPLWMSARAGHLQPGDSAPDFDLPLVDHSRRVRISEEYLSRPVVLIFGSYT